MNRELPLVLFCAYEVASFADTAKPPNVIFILADDLGIGNLSCYGSDNCKSPNIDKLAATGTRYTRAFTVSLCGPSMWYVRDASYNLNQLGELHDLCPNHADANSVSQSIAIKDVVNYDSQHFCYCDDGYQGRGSALGG